MWGNERVWHVQLDEHINAGDSGTDNRTLQNNPSDTLYEIPPLCASHTYYMCKQNESLAQGFVLQIFQIYLYIL